MVGSAGIASGQLWLLYLGYGVIGGIGLGIGYISPVSTLIKWFPDRPGLATGMAIMGFGGGALIASPLSNRLMSRLRPRLRGHRAGRGRLRLGARADLPDPRHRLHRCSCSSAPRSSASPRATATTSTAEHSPGTNGALVRASSAIRTPQFWFLWVVLFCNVTAGIGILEQAAPMIQDFFRDSEGSTVTAAAAGGFVGVLSLANMLGRFVWSSLSDLIGRKPTYVMYLGVGLVLYLLLALFGSVSPLVFVALAAVIISYYGGGFATVPAYLKDLFGTLEVGAIHGRLLTAWAAAGVAGPLIVNGILDRIGEPGNLVAADYRPALLTMVGVLAVGFIANLMIRPVAESHFDADAHAAHDERVADRQEATR